MIKVDLTKSFPITSVCREDLLSNGYTKKEISKITDDQMEKIADKMSDYYSDSGYWEHLESACEYVLEDNA